MPIGIKVSHLAIATMIATAAASGTPAMAYAFDPAEEAGNPTAEQETAATRPADAPAPAAQAAGGMEDIVVTARRVQERLQDVPVSVTAFSATRLAELRPENIGTLTSLAPNLIVTPATGAGAGGNIFIRGIGQNDPSPYLDAPTSVYVNGVIRPRTSLNFAQLGIIDRIEVLRGPQGTLFGRNTTGGAINIFTPAPTRDSGGTLSIGVGSDHEFTTRAVLNSGEIGESGLRFRGSYYHRQIGGVVENPGLPSSRWAGALNADGVDLRLAGNWGRFSAEYEFDYNNNRSVSYNQQIIFFVNQDLLNYFNQSAALGGGSIIISPTKLDVQESRTFPRQVATDRGHALTLNYELSDSLSLKSITAYREADESRPANASSQPFLLGRVQDASSPDGYIITEVTPLQTPIRDLNQHQFSEEVQLLGRFGDFNVVGGFFYFRERLSENNVNFNTRLLPNGLGTNTFSRRDYDYETDSWAGFGQVTWRPSALGGRLDLTGGIRYTEDRKAIDDRGYVNDVQNRSFTGSDTFNNTSVLASVGYRWTPGVMTYARFSTGYKAGGFVPGSAFESFKPELVTSYEIGLKSELWSRVRFNLAAFYSRYRDLQVSGRIADPVTGIRVSTLTNAGRAHYTGIEAELSARLGGGFSFDGNIGYVDPVYDQFPYFTGTEDINVADEAKFPYVAKLTFDAGLRYTVPTPIGQLNARVNYQYQSARYFFALTRINVNNDRIRAPGQGFLNARLSLSDVDIGVGHNARIELYVDNILNTDRILGSIDSTNYASTFFGRGRQGGMQVTFDF
ncbi:TonB-dependent receptor [Sphingosinicella ginsenosidimutans]|nr:TonB-dependent receptor [Sphingosinicella ginsenosidimutans]